jgi:Beta-propeller repeat
VGFELAKYDASRPLYIDPLIYSTYLGGSGGDYGFGIAVDSAGNAYGSRRESWWRWYSQ